MKRLYDNTSRAQKSAQTADRVLDSTEALIKTMPLGELKLTDVAAGADVSVQTILRHFKSRDGLLEQVASRFVERVQEQRSNIEPGDIGEALARLLAHYEAEGDLVLRLLAQESQTEFAKRAVAYGREFHRDWIQTLFRPVLPNVGPAEYERRIDALVVATDLYTWKLLRRDMGRNLTEVQSTIETLINAAIMETS